MPKQLSKKEQLRERMTEQITKFIKDFQSDDGEYPIGIFGLRHKQN